MHSLGSIENLLNNTDQLKGALKKKVEENVEQIRFSRFLATIKTDVPLDVEMESLKRIEPDKQALRNIFEQLEFRAFIKRLFPEEVKTEKRQPMMASLFDEMPAEAPAEKENTKLRTIADSPHFYHLIENKEDAKKLCEKLLTYSVVAIDTETTSTDAISAELLGMSFAAVPGEAGMCLFHVKRRRRVSLSRFFNPSYKVTRF